MIDYTSNIDFDRHGSAVILLELAFYAKSWIITFKCENNKELDPNNINIGGAWFSD